MSEGLRTGYKQTEVGVIPQAWDVKRIADIAFVGSGGTPRREVAAYWGGSIPWVTTSQVDFGAITEADQFITDEGLQNSAAKLLPPGTLLMALYGQGKTRGKVGVLAMQAATNQACASISLREGVSREFVLHFLTSRYEQIRNSSNSGSQENLNGSIVKGTWIAFPPLLEQRVIAAALGDVDALLAKLDEFIAKKRDLKQAAMHQLLTGQTRLPGFSGEWEVKRLGELLSYEQPTKYLVSSSEYSDANDVPVLTAGKTFILGYTNEMGGIFADLPAIIFDDFTTATKYVTFPFKAKSSAMKILKPRKPAVNLRLVYEIIQVIDFKLGDHKRYWISEYSKLEVKIPDAAEQTAIAIVLSDMDTELTALEARREKTRGLKQGMMQELLTGRIRLV
jgi:type I restriction enzyme, S subunit